MNQHVPVMDGDTLARRNALVLAGAQALGGASPAIGGNHHELAH
eukprot:gene10265-13185_t